MHGYYIPVPPTDLSYLPSSTYPSLSFLLSVSSPHASVFSLTLLLWLYSILSLTVCLWPVSLRPSFILLFSFRSCPLYWFATHTLSLFSFSFTPVIEMEEWEHLSFANGWWWRIRFLCCNAIETSPPGMRNTGWESNVLDVFAPLWTIIHRHWLLMEQLWKNLGILIPL